MQVNKIPWNILIRRVEGSWKNEISSVGLDGIFLNPSEGNSLIKVLKIIKPNLYISFGPNNEYSLKSHLLIILSTCLP